MKRTVRSEKKIATQSGMERDKRLERIWLGLVAGIAGAALLHEWTFDSGQFVPSSSYRLLLWGAPALAGISGVLLFLWKEAPEKCYSLLRGQMRFWDALAAVFFTLLCGVMAGLIFITLPAGIIWDRVNWSHAQKAVALREYVPVRKFTTSSTRGKRRDYIIIEIDGRRFSLETDAGVVYNYRNQDSGRYQLWIERHPGMLGTSYITAWRLDPK